MSQLLMKKEENSQRRGQVSNKGFSIKGSNIEAWGKDPHRNVMYLTGYSGSGKTTLAKRLSDKKTDVVHLDSYIDRWGKGKNKKFDRYLSSMPPKIILQKPSTRFRTVGSDLLKIHQSLMSTSMSVSPSSVSS